MIYFHIIIQNIHHSFPYSQIGSRFIRRRLLQRLYDRALTIGLQGYAQLYVVQPSEIYVCASLGKLTLFGH